MSKVPHPFQVVAFFLMAVNFALWQPFVWWRAGAAVLMLGSAAMAFTCCGGASVRSPARSLASLNDRDVDDGLWTDVCRPSLYSWVFLSWRRRF